MKSGCCSGVTCKLSDKFFKLQAIHRSSSFYQVGSVGSIIMPNDTNEHSNPDLVAWFQNLFYTGSTLGAFFAGFTLNIVVSESAQKKARVRHCAAISSLLFVLTVLLCSAFSLAFAFHESIDLRTWRWPLAALSITLQLLVLAAIYFFFQVMLAYAWRTGLVGTGFTVAAAVVAVPVWVWQSFIA